MINLVDLPDVVLEHVFSFLTFDSVAQNRIVCKRFNIVGGRVLNKGFYAVEKFNSKTVREIKGKLPRRESERKNHPLERQCCVLISIETRINMLAMTYSKWINNESCCFIPGKVIDEIYWVIRSVIKNIETPNDNEVRAIEILQELRDISSMAIDHFDDKILPQLKRNYYRSSMESMVDINGVGGDDGGLVNMLDGLIKRSHLRSPGLNTGVGGVLSVNKSSFSTPLNLFTQPMTSGALSHPHYLRLLIRESVNRFRLQTQAVQISTQSREIAELRKQVEEWEEKFKELNAIVLKQASPNTPSKLLIPTEGSQPQDGSGPSSDTINETEKPETSGCEGDAVSLKRKLEDPEEGPSTESKIPKILTLSTDTLTAGSSVD